MMVLALCIRILYFQIGIVGRTGAGKTSLLGCILRLMDTTRGNILIDGTNIKLLGLQELRSSISVISQTPALIEGTLRQNLDIRNEFSDLKLWNVLTAVQLKSRVAKGLQTRVIISKYPRITPVA